MVGFSHKPKTKKAPAFSVHACDVTVRHSQALENCLRTDGIFSKSHDSKPAKVSVARHCTLDRPQFCNPELPRQIPLTSQAAGHRTGRRGMCHNLHELLARQKQANQMLPPLFSHYFRQSSSSVGATPTDDRQLMTSRILGE